MSAKAAAIIVQHSIAWPRQCIMQEFQAQAIPRTAVLSMRCPIIHRFPAKCLVAAAPGPARTACRPPLFDATLPHLLPFLQAESTVSREATVGQVQVQVTLTNYREAVLARLGQFDANQVHRYETEALIDTGAVQSVIP